MPSKKPKSRDDALRAAFNDFKDHLNMNSSYPPGFGPGPCDNPKHMEEALTDQGFRLVKTRAR